MWFSSRSRRSSTRTHSWESLRFLAGNSRLFIVTWPFLTQPSPRATLQGRPTVSEPPFRHYGNRFFECARTAATFPENFYREPVRPVNRTCVQVVTSWPPQFGSFLKPPFLPLASPSLLLNSAARFARTSKRASFNPASRSDCYPYSEFLMGFRNLF